MQHSLQRERERERERVRVRVRVRELLNTEEKANIDTLLTYFIISEVLSPHKLRSWGHLSLTEYPCLHKTGKDLTGRIRISISRIDGLIHTSIILCVCVRACVNTTSTFSALYSLREMIHPHVHVHVYPHPHIHVHVDV